MKISILNLILLTTIVGLAVALILALNKEHPPIRVRSDHDYFSWVFGHNNLDSPPLWLETDKNPPLSVRDAISITDEIALNVNQATEKRKIGNWNLDCLYLSPLSRGFGQPREKWIYVANFSGTNLGMHFGPPFRMSMIILMDGTVLPGHSDHGGKVDAEIRKIYPRREQPPAAETSDND